jgi:hypothetical protein
MRIITVKLRIIPAKEWVIDLSNESVGLFILKITYFIHYPNLIHKKFYEFVQQSVTTFYK